MKDRLITRGGLLAGMMLAGAACCALAQRPAATLPVTQPTSNFAAGAAISPVQEKPVLEKEAAPRTRVTWLDGMLTISAENSSLNQILREISRQTGMKVTGGVRDERVFGSYGPGTPDAVLVSLLTGTGSNMLLKEDKTGGPTELVLSARAGGATPPSPGAGAERDPDADAERTPPPQRAFPARVRPEPFRPPAGMSIPDPNYNNGQGATIGQGATTADGASTNPSSTPASVPDQPSSDGAKTPQEIYDQLVKMQKEKAGQTPPQ